MYIERWYQEEAADKTVKFIEEKDGHPIVVLPTGTGKSVVIAGITNRYLSRWPAGDVLILSHVQEILEQNHEKLETVFDGYEIGLWSAGLGIKDKRKITVAGIQSVFRSPEMFKNVTLVIIDECHLINHKNQGMYRKFLAKLNAVYVGLTATPFRLGHGYIHIGDNTLFSDIVYDMSSFENFNRLVNEGYLARLISKKTALHLDLKGVKTRGGDFVQEELSERVDRKEITHAAIREILFYGTRYNKWLIFAINIEHAEHIAAVLRENGIPTGIIHSKMDGDRDQELEKLHSGEYRAMVNVDVLTTGFDEPGIDMIVDFCPTQSPVKHVQAKGRGTRPVYAPEYDLNTVQGRLAAIKAGPKPHCLVLDFAGNTKRLGPINDVLIKQKGEKKRKGEAITKECPNPKCGVISHPSVRICPGCGHKFEFKEKITHSADEEEVFQTEKKKKEKKKVVGWADIDEINYSVHSRKGKPSSLLVRYRCGLNVVKQFINLDHGGYPRHLAKHWINMRLPENEPFPKDVASLYKIAYKLKRPKSALVDATEKYPKILEYRW